MKDEELEDRIKHLEAYYNYEGKSVDAQLIEEIIGHIEYLEEELEERSRQMRFHYYKTNY